MKTESQFRSFCLHVASLPFWSKLHGNLPSKLSKSKAKRWQWCAYGPRAPGYPYTCPGSCNHYGVMNKKIVRQKNFEIILFYSALFYQNQTMSLFHSDFSGIPFNCLGGRGLQCAFGGQCQQLFWGELLGAVALSPALQWGWWRHGAGNKSAGKICFVSKQNTENVPLLWFVLNHDILLILNLKLIKRECKVFVFI